MKTKIVVILTILIGIIMISGCVDNSNSSDKTPQYDVDFIKKNAVDLNAKSVTLKGTLVELCITNSALWMGGNFRDASGELPVIFNGADEHGCKDANYDTDKVEYEATIGATIMHKEMTDNTGKSVGIVTFLEVNNIIDQSNFPSAPTQQERDDAKKLPREECPCWVEIETGKGECHPQADCV